MKLVIRDDDLSYYADPRYLDQLYSEIWDKSPIHFATVPNIGPVMGAIPIKQTKINKYYKISENKKLVDFLKQKIKEGRVVIWQHGYSHKNYGNKFELERKDFNQIYKELKEGKEYL